MQQILIAEDNEKTRTLVAQYLERAGFAVVHAADGRSALFQARQQRPDLAVLDWMLPEVDGLTVCQVLRRELALPIIMLTARTTEDDRIQGLQRGADDYLSKPFSPRELVARVQAVLRRVADHPVRARRVDTRVEVGDVTIDFARREVTIRGRRVELTATELRLFEALAAAPGRVFSRDDLIRRAFGDDYDGRPRTVDMHVRNLRRKIEIDPASPRYIRSVYGEGYRFHAEQEPR